MNVKNLKKIDRPREKLIYNGPSSLTDSELLAILLDTGTKEYNVLELADKIIEDIGIDKLLNVSYNDLAKIKGIKMRKASKLIASFEIAKRSMVKNNNYIYLKSSLDCFNYIKDDYLFLGVERVIIVYVDSSLKIIKKTIFDSFEVAISNLPLKLIIKEAINYNALGIFISHNHPSGNPRPSKSDILATINLYNTLKNINIILFDHIIVSDDLFFSFNDELILKKIENGEIIL
ncbi:MAG: DNA repair protein RadC [Acholeplasmatales bacterium]|nr:DNA repair protein RadC [Acholeplasmatales bacterium]